ncbi:MAG: hypothetical protein ACJAYG_001702 [Oceanicoccus sp.]|jgi:hypothetical protein
MYRLMVVLLVGLALAACDTGTDSPDGFSLPQGDAVLGKKVFLQTGCLSCHAIKDVESDIKLELDQQIVLGGQVNEIKTYAELVTSVINPSHKVAKNYLIETAALKQQPPMRNYNDTLTVTQLVDLVTFLELQYELVPYQPSNYGMYYP